MARMNRKSAAGIAAAIIIFSAILCFWTGNKIVPKLPPAVESTNSQIVSGSDFEQKARSIESKKIHLLFGNPSGATSDISNFDNYLMINEEFALSYNRSNATANWVAWRITGSDMSDLPRDDSYRPDDRLPNGWARITPGDYNRSGYTRGHLCPSADRDKDPGSMAATFLMTNMVPQTRDLNTGPWAELESDLRSRARRGNDVYVFAGVYGEKGKIKRKLTIPANNWKIAVIISTGSGLESVDEKTEVVAVDMPNMDGIKNVPWKNYRVTIREIEKKTGYNFLSNLGQSLQDKLEN